MIKRLQTIGMLCLLLIVAIVTKAGDVTALWDFQNVNPSTLKTEAASGVLNAKTGYLTSTESSIKLYVDASTGKLQQRNTDAQFNSGAKIQVPVKSTKDTVTIVSYPSYYYYTIGGVAATENTTVHRATVAEAAQGYVEIVATNTAYLYSIKVVQVDMIQEKKLYSTDFSDWTKAGAAASESTVAQNTKYSHETLNFALYDVAVDPAGVNTKFNNGAALGWLQAAKSADPYITTSALASITKVRFVHAATGGSRGYKLEAKGDGDTDWVTISSDFADPSSWCEVTKDINKTNCQLRFTNLNSSQNAYLFQLDIYGKVDMSKAPALGTFKANSALYTAADIFNEQADGTMTATIELSKKATMISESNPLTDIVADNGEVTSTTYVTKNDTTVATIVVTANSINTSYIATFVFKPDYTLTYYNTDGTALGTQAVEKDATIGTFAKTETDVTVAEGKKFRGWFVGEAGSKKYTTADVITANSNLYAIATDIETASKSAIYTFDLNNPYFYDEDHEAYESVGSGKFHDATHGWVFNTNDSIKIIVGGEAYISLGLCAYSGSSANITLAGADKTAISSISAKASSDGKIGSFHYTGEAGTLYITFDGTTYLHSLAINNIADGTVSEGSNGYYNVKAGDANAFLKTLAVANANSSSEKRTCIYLPDGTYDLGKTVLTPVSGDNISIIGQSMDKTIIKNAPAIANEGIGTTATLYNTSTGLYLQDLTLQNALDYYATGAAGRAVCLQDKGTQTICKNVKMLSYQDTYYSNNDKGQYYWETSDIHGCVDYICGGGDAFFNKCTLTVESRTSTAGSGDCTITAPYTNSTWGYVFDHCTIVNNAASFNFGRAWGGAPRCAYLNTTLPETGLISTRWTPLGMNVVADKFVEYNSVNAAGTVVSPESNKVKFYLNATSKEMETIISADDAASYSLDKVFTNWTPATYTAQITAPVVKADGSSLTWTGSEGAKAFMILCDGEAVDIVSGSTNSYTLPTTAKGTTSVSKTYSVRAANAMGGFGEAGIANGATGISNVKADDVINTSYYNLQGAMVNSAYNGVVIKVNTMKDGSKTTSKVIR